MDDLTGNQFLTREEKSKLKALSSNGAFDEQNRNAVIKIFDRLQKHIIISDQRMPELTGVEFLSKTIPLMPKTIRMLLTGYSDIDAVVDSINKGRIYQFLFKPFVVPEIFGRMPAQFSHASVIIFQAVGSVGFVSPDPSL